VQQLFGELELQESWFGTKQHVACHHSVGQGIEKTDQKIRIVQNFRKDILETEVNGCLKRDMRLANFSLIQKLGITQKTSGRYNSMAMSDKMSKLPQKHVEVRLLKQRSIDKVT